MSRIVTVQNPVAVVLLLLICLLCRSVNVCAQSVQTLMTDAFKKYIPENTAVDKIWVRSVRYDNSGCRVTVNVSEGASQLSWSAEELDKLTKSLQKCLPPAKRGFRIRIMAKGIDMSTLVYGVPRNNKVDVNRRERFVRPLTNDFPTQGLDGYNIALWHSHGRYYNIDDGVWRWQRPRLFTTIEDIYTQSYVVPLLAPMLENSGAYVMLPRERDISTTEIIIDPDGPYAFNNGYRETNGDSKWSDGGNGFGYYTPTFQDGENPFRQGRYRRVKGVVTGGQMSEAVYSADIPVSGIYAVYVSYSTEEISSDSALYTVHTGIGDKTYMVNQRMGGGTWVYLGAFPFEAGKGKKIVSLNNSKVSDDECITADAVKLGGGYGNILRSSKNRDKFLIKGTVSGLPRYIEGARYWLQWAGMPDSVYSESAFADDYADDYKSRGLWVNYISGGSIMNPRNKGLGIPVDLAFGMHSDAGTTDTDSIIGTLAIYSTDKGSKLGNGASRLSSRDLADFIQTQVVNDVRNNFTPGWTRRKLWDRAYAEARSPLVPSVLLEVLSHQNFSDMCYGLNPEFRFTVARAVYKGMLKFLKGRDNVPYIVQPLPVKNFEIRRLLKGENVFQLKWEATPDDLEITATPDYYIVEQRVNNGFFSPVATTKEPIWIFQEAVPDSIYSFRIIACNKGGSSFPSEVLSAGISRQSNKTITVVNGFTRLSSPEWIMNDTEAGFPDSMDKGVDYKSNICYSGPQTEFLRGIAWVDDDNPGSGASAGGYENKVIGGNTFDYPAVHGEAIIKSGYSFVSTSLNAFINDSDDFDGDAVDIIFGKQKETKTGLGDSVTKYKVFTSALQRVIRQMVARKVPLMVSGAYVVSDIFDNSFSSESTIADDEVFAQTILGIKANDNDAISQGPVFVVSESLPAFVSGPFHVNTDIGRDYYSLENIDSPVPSDNVEAKTVMRYSDTQGSAAVAFSPGNGNGRVVTLGFPFENVDNSKNRANIMAQILDFLIK